MKKPNPMRHLTGLVDDLQFLDKATAKLRAAKTRKWNEEESINLAVSMALENNEMFEDFCEAQYPTQGKVLFKALLRAKKHIGVTYRSQRSRKPRKEADDDAN